MSPPALPAAIHNYPLLAENARLRAENARLLVERAALASFIAASEPTEDREHNLARIVAAAAAALDSPSAALLLYSVAGDRTVEGHFAGYAAPEEARRRALEQPPSAVPTEQHLRVIERPVITVLDPDDHTRPRPDLAGGAAHLLVIPLFRHDRLGGCLRLERPLNARPFDHHDAALSAQLAGLLALLLSRADGYDAAQRRAVRADALREIGRELSTELDLERFCQTASRHLTRLMDAQDLWFGLWDEVAGELSIPLYIRAGRRRDDYDTMRLRPEDNRGLASALLTERKTINVPDYLQECQRRGLAAIVPDGEWVGLAWIGVPLLSNGHLVGVLAVERFHRLFSAEEVMLLESLAGHLAASLENARLFAELRSMAATDPLTGLANHRHIHERLAQELARAARHGQPLAVAMLDLNDFKSYNDTHGHQAGDQLLRAVAQALRAETRATDIVGRYGGDEFLLVLPDTATPEAVALLDRIRARLHAASTPPTPAGTVRVTTGVGLAFYPTDAITAHELVARADAALYADKRAYHAAAAH